MDNPIRTNVLIIHKNQLSTENIKFIKNDLTNKIFNEETNKYDYSFYFFEDENFLYLPKYYDNNPTFIEKIKSSNWEYFSKIEEKFTEGHDIEIDFNKNSEIKFRDDVQEKSVDFLVNNDYGILCLVPGKGKTFISCCAIAKIKKKTLIVVDQIELMKQWIENLLKVTDIYDEQFKDKDELKSWIDDFANNNKRKIDCNIGIIKESRFDIDKDVVVTTAQSLISLLKKDYQGNIAKFYNANFGLILYDEVHCLIGPQKTTHITYLSYAKKIYGLSATPYRSDKTDKLLKMYLGYNMMSDDGYDLIPNVYRMNIKSKIPYKTVIYYIQQDFYMDKLKYIKQLVKYDEYTYYNLLMYHILDCLDKNRCILVLADYIFILEGIYNRLTTIVDLEQMDMGDIFINFINNKKSKIYKSKSHYNKNKNEIMCAYYSDDSGLSKFKNNWFDKDVYLISYEGKEYMYNKFTKETFLLKYKINPDDISIFTSNSERIYRGKKIVFSTFKMCSKGINNEEWDTLFMATPILSKASIEQSVGRILRQAPNKKTPYVYDFCDHNGKLIDLSTKRYQQYEKNNFPIIDLKYF